MTDPFGSAEDASQIDWASFLENGRASLLENGRQRDSAVDDSASIDNDLVMQLVSNTSLYALHVTNRPEQGLERFMESVPRAPTNEWETLPKALHPVELVDWEKQILWGSPQQENEQDGSNEGNKQVPKVNAAEILGERRNPYLDALQFDDSTISWSGSPRDLERKARNVGLNLELGVAGRSIARSLLPVSRPTPFAQTDVYTKRRQLELSEKRKSEATGSVTKSLHQDKKELERIIKANQAQRKQNEIEKVNRIKKHKEVIGLGNCKGHAIKSAVEGPGGADTKKHSTKPPPSYSVPYRHTYIEHPKFVANHELVKMVLTRAHLQQHHRPIIVALANRPWQFRIQVDFDTHDAFYPPEMGFRSIACVKQIVAKEDLSPTDGDLVLLEYCEERPPIQLVTGMASRIVNFYRGDRAHCPVSAGGGDRPTERMKAGREKRASTVPARFVGPNSVKTSLVDWIGRPSEDLQEHKEPTVDVLPEGVTEILCQTVHGPFLGQLEEGMTQTGLISNLFVAPMFLHKSASTDFLMILNKRPCGEPVENGAPQPVEVVLRPLPSSIFTVGQTEPRVTVPAPRSTADRAVTINFLCFQAAKMLTLVESMKGRGMEFREIHDLFFANSNYPDVLRKSIHSFATKERQEGKKAPIWRVEPAGMEALSKECTPEAVVRYETTRAASVRLENLGLQRLLLRKNNLEDVGAAVTQLYTEMNASHEALSRLTAMRKSVEGTQAALYEKAATKLEYAWNYAKKRYDIGEYIYEELQLSPWTLTGDFIDVQQGGKRKERMELTGLGDPSGQNEGYSFLRAPKEQAADRNALGEDKNLRKLTMPQLETHLRALGVQQEVIETIEKRWDRVHMLRDLATKAVADGYRGELQKYARDEKMTADEKDKVYRSRIQEIWGRQRAALSAGDTSGSRSGGAVSVAAASVGADTRAVNAESPVQNKNVDNDSDYESDDDAFAAEMEEDMMDESQSNDQVAARARGGDGPLGQRRAGDMQDVSKEDARQLAVLQREQKEERALREDFISRSSVASESSCAAVTSSRKVLRRRITRSYPDGRQTVSFKFVMQFDDSAVPKACKRGPRKILVRLAMSNDGGTHGDHVNEGILDEPLEAVIPKKCRGGQLVEESAQMIQLVHGGARIEEVAKRDFLTGQRNGWRKFLVRLTVSGEEYEDDDGVEEDVSCERLEALVPIWKKGRGGQLVEEIAQMIQSVDGGARIEEAAKRDFITGQRNGWRKFLVQLTVSGEEDEDFCEPLEALVPIWRKKCRGGQLVQETAQYAVRKVRSRKRGQKAMSDDDDDDDDDDADDYEKENSFSRPRKALVPVRKSCRVPSSAQSLETSQRGSVGAQKSMNATTGDEQVQRKKRRL